MRTLQEIAASLKAGGAPQDYERAALEVVEVASEWPEGDLGFPEAMRLAQVYATLAVASALVEPFTGNGVASMLREAGRG